MAINEQSSDEELLRKEINRITAILRDLRKSGKTLDEGLLKNIASMTKTADAWGKQLTVATASIEKEKSMAARWADRSTSEMKALKLRKLMNTEAQASRKLLQQQKSDDVERHIKMRSAMGKASDSFNFFTKSLTKGLGFGEAIGIATEKLRQMSQAAMEQMKLEEMQKAYDDEAAKGGSAYEQGEEGKKASHDLDEQKKLVAGLGGNTGGEGMGKMQKSLGKMGKFASKHAGGMLLGAGAGGLILGVIIKALSVAPMFQAMMKLFKFAVTMILMPIGTFFGAVLRPIMIGLIKTIAPQFKGWMKTAMKLGDQVGKFIMDFFTDPATYLLGAMGGRIPMIVSAFSFPDWSTWNPFDDGKTQEEKDEEHTAYWEGVNKSLEDAWNSIYTPISEFAVGVTEFFTVTIPSAFNDVWTTLQDVGKMLAQPFLMFIGTINTIFLWQLPMMFEDFWTWVSSGFTNLQSALTEWLQPILDFLGFGTTEDDMNRAKEASNAVSDAMDQVKNFFDSVFGNTESVFDFSGAIDRLWKKITGNTEDSEDHSDVTEHAMESIAKIFDSSATWISNALRRVSRMRYTKKDGSTAPTPEAKIAKKTLNEGVPMIMAGGSIKDWYSSFKTAGNGFSGMVNSPTMFMAGEAGAEHISISPHGSKSSGGAVININIAKIERDADFNQLKPMIQRWILEANSRRGMI